MSETDERDGVDIGVVAVFVAVRCGDYGGGGWVVIWVGRETHLVLVVDVRIGGVWCDYYYYLFCIC